VQLLRQNAPETVWQSGSARTRWGMVIMQIGWSSRYTDKRHLYVYTRYSDERLCQNYSMDSDTGTIFVFGTHLEPTP